MEQPDYLYYATNDNDNDNYNHAEVEYNAEVKRHAANKAAFDAGYAAALADRRELDQLSSNQLLARTLRQSNENIARQKGFLPSNGLTAPAREVK